MNQSKSYPHTLYCSILLLDHQIIDYKIGQTYWHEKGMVTLRGQISWEDYERATVKWTTWEVHNDKECQEVFDHLAVEWMESQSSH